MEERMDLLLLTVIPKHVFMSDQNFDPSFFVQINYILKFIYSHENIDQNLYSEIFLSTLSAYELKCEYMIYHLDSSLNHEKELSVKVAWQPALFWHSFKYQSIIVIFSSSAANCWQHRNEVYEYKNRH